MSEKSTENNGKPNLKKINHRTFCACMTVAGATMGSGMVACNKEDDGDNFTNATLTADQVTALRSQGYLNIIDTAIVVYDSGTNNYRAFTNYCPHEDEKILAESTTSFRCQKHTSQLFTGTNAQGNGARTSSSLRALVTVENSDGSMTIASS